MPQALANLLRARHPCIRIMTEEEPEALAWVQQAAHELGITDVRTWSILQGLRDATFSDALPEPDTEQPAAALFYCATRIVTGAVLVFFDLGPHLDDPRTLRALREAVHRRGASGGTIILIDQRESGPPALATIAIRAELPLPNDDQLAEVAKGALRAVPCVEIDMTRGTFNSVVQNLRGLTKRQARQVVLDVIADDHKFNANDVAGIISAKRRLLQTAGLLEFVESPASMDQIGGLDRLKQWLAAREKSFSTRAREFGLLPPRGILLLGVQGAGKSLCAKAVATAWRRPLLRMDPGVLYDRYVGESEKRLRDALRQAEAMSPIVLWIDEIEKAFASAASQSTDGGLSQRMFGTLLTWMQEHQEPVFTVATANNIEALPPELLRKGRFDEIFFVDLPGEDARRQILAIHLARRGRDTSKIDVAALARACEGFSGAEIEQAILSALHEAYALGVDVSTEGIARAIRGSPPLSVTMAERIAGLRAWARDRCVNAE